MEKNNAFYTEGPNGPFGDYQQHFEKIAEVHSVLGGLLNNPPPKPPSKINIEDPFDLLARLSDAVQAEYPEDSSSAGVVVARIPNGHYYVSVCRYPRYNQKNVVVSTSQPDLKTALVIVAQQWLSRVRKPPKEHLLDKLAEILR